MLVTTYIGTPFYSNKQKSSRNSNMANKLEYGDINNLQDGS